LFGALLGLLLTSLVPVSSPDTPLVLFGAGALAITAMLLPGISGSFILLVLGKYVVVLEALSEFELSIIAPFVAGCALGIVTFAKLLETLLERHHALMAWVMAGLLLGSLQKVWPFQERSYELIRGKERLTQSMPTLPQSVATTELYAMGLVLLGFASVWLLHRLKRQD